MSILQKIMKLEVVQTSISEDLDQSTNLLGWNLVGTSTHCGPILDPVCAQNRFKARMQRDQDCDAIESSSISESGSMACKIILKQNRTQEYKLKITIPLVLLRDLLIMSFILVSSTHFEGI